MRFSSWLFYKHYQSTIAVSVLSVVCAFTLFAYLNYFSPSLFIARGGVEIWINQGAMNFSLPHLYSKIWFKTAVSISIYFFNKNNQCSTCFKLRNYLVAFLSYLNWRAKCLDACANFEQFWRENFARLPTEDAPMQK